MEYFSEKEVASFQIIEDHPSEIKAEKENSRGRYWVGTWNNPKMSDEEFLEYLKGLEQEEILQYAVFQRERGELNGTIHFQFFLEFKNKQYFSKLKKEIIPPGCHFAPMRSNSRCCKNYCSKNDGTRVSGPYEVGEFTEQGKRTDLMEAIKELDDGIPFEAIRQRYPTQSVMYEQKLKNRERENFNNKLKTLCRNIEITFVYGPPRAGKTTYVNAQAEFDFNNIFVIENYGQYMFTGYDRQKFILFDEFTGQVKITEMNKLLEPFPKLLNVKGGVVQAAYEKIFIVSNYSLNELYKDCKEEQLESYKAFCERIHKIIRFDKQGNQYIERDSIWEDIPQEKQKIPGLTRQVKQTYQIDSKGKKTILYDRYKPIQETIEYALETTIETLFED